MLDDAKIGSVPVRCVVASLAFPASPASGTCFLAEKYKALLWHFQTSTKKNKGLKIPCTPLASADHIAISTQGFGHPARHAQPQKPSVLIRDSEGRPSCGLPSTRSTGVGGFDVWLLPENVPAWWYNPLSRPFFSARRPRLAFDGDSHSAARAVAPVGFFTERSAKPSEFPGFACRACPGAWAKGERCGREFLG